MVIVSELQIVSDDKFHEMPPPPPIWHPSRVRLPIRNSGKRRMEQNWGNQHLHSSLRATDSLMTSVRFFSFSFSEMVLSWRSATKLFIMYVNKPVSQVVSSLFAYFRVSHSRQKLIHFYIIFQKFRISETFKRPS